MTTTSVAAAFERAQYAASSVVGSAASPLKARFRELPTTAPTSPMTTIAEAALIIAAAKQQQQSPRGFVAAPPPPSLTSTASALPPLTIASCANGLSLSAPLACTATNLASPIGALTPLASPARSQLSAVLDVLRQLETSGAKSFSAATAADTPTADLLVR